MKWTIENLQTEANKYNTRKEFRKKSSAYSTAKNKKLLNVIFENHDNFGYDKNRKNRNYWTVKKLQAEANKYNNISEFNKNNNNAYQAAIKKKCLTKIFEKHINNGIYIKPIIYYDFNFLKNITNTYNTREEFRLNEKPIYSYVLKNNLLNILFENHKNNGYIKSQQKWTKDVLQTEANKYSTRKEFSQNKLAYSAATKKKLLNELFEHHKNNGYLNKKWEKNRYTIYVYEFSNKAYVGLTNNITRRDKEHLYGKCTLSNYCKLNNIALPNYKILQDKLDSISAKKMEEHWLNIYKQNGWNMLNIAKCGSLGSYDIWSIKKVQKEANKYLTRWEFGKNCPSAYNYAIKNKLIDKLFKNHKNGGIKNNNNYYSIYENCLNEAKKYNNPTQFTASCAYKHIIKHDWKQKIYSDMNWKSNKSHK